MKTQFTLHTRSLFSGSMRARVKPALFAAAIALLLPGALWADDDDRPFLPGAVRSATTIPSNGDLNPYGIAFVPPQFPAGGAAKPGDVLVSNFNGSKNLQGTGTTIVNIPTGGATALFFQGQPGLGLTTALNILKKGFVLVGNFPSTDGTCGTAKAGSVLVIDKSGNLVSTISDPLINGPWDSALFDQGSSAKFFVSNGLSGTVVRLDLAVGASGVTVKKITQIASGYAFGCDPVAFVNAPTGLVYDEERDVLYVASTKDNEIFAVGDARDTKHDRGPGTVVYADNVHLHGPIAMIQAPNGHLVVSNNDAVNTDPKQPSELVEFTKKGEFVKQISIDPVLDGDFGIAAATSGDLAHFAAVDDNQNILLLWTFKLPE